MQFPVMSSKRENLSGGAGARAFTCDGEEKPPQSNETPIYECVQSTKKFISGKPTRF